MKRRNYGWANFGACFAWAGAAERDACITKKHQSHENAGWNPGSLKTHDFSQILFELVIFKQFSNSVMMYTKFSAT